MLVYYLVVSIIALIFFLFLAWLRKFFRGLSLKLIALMVLWVYLLSFFLPGLMSFISPVIAFSGVLLLVLFGGYFLFEKNITNKSLQEKAVLGEDKCEAKPEPVELLKPVEPEPVEARKVSVAKLPAFPEQGITDVRKIIPVTNMLPKELLTLPKEFLLPPAWKEPLFLISEGIKAQRKEVTLLTENKFDFQGLIDSAFQAKEEKNFPLAVEKFKAALSQTRDVSLKGMIYTEFVFLYKEMGKYLEAAGLIEGFLLENGSSLSASLRRHFEKVVQYLLTIEELLKKTEHPDLPFSQIPQLIKIRAEKIFQE